MNVAQATQDVAAKEQSAAEALTALEETRRVELEAQSKFDAEGDDALGDALKTRLYRERADRMHVAACDALDAANLALARAEREAATERYEKAKTNAEAFAAKVQFMANRLIEHDRKVQGAADHLADAYVDFEAHLAEATALGEALGKLDIPPRIPMAMVRDAVKVAITLARERDERPHDDWLVGMARPVWGQDHETWNAALSLLGVNHED